MNYKSYNTKLQNGRRKNNKKMCVMYKTNILVQWSVVSLFDTPGNLLYFGENSPGKLMKKPWKTGEKALESPGISFGFRRTNPGCPLYCPISCHFLMATGFQNFGFLAMFPILDFGRFLICCLESIFKTFAPKIVSVAICFRLSLIFP